MLVAAERDIARPSPRLTNSGLRGRGTTGWSLVRAKNARDLFAGNPSIDPAC